MQRVTRHQIKRNELAEAVERTVHYTEDHLRLVGIAVGAVVLVVLAVLGVRWFLKGRAAEADEALAAAVRVHQAPVGVPAPKPEDPKEPSFADETARRARAKQLFEEVREGYGMSDAAGVAAVYLGQIAVAEGQLDDARELWEEYLNDDDDSLLASQTRLNLMALDRQQGKGEELVRQLQEMLDEPEPSLPQDVVLFELATTYEQLGRQPEADEAYQRIVTEHPQSPYRQSAQQKVADQGGLPGLGGLGGFGGPGGPGGPGGLPPGLVPGS